MKNKGLSKGLKVGGIIVGVILLVMILVPIIFKGKIKEIVVKTANDMLEAKVEITDFGLNLFSSFPDATLSLKDVTISGVNEFEGDTLLQGRSLSVTINLASLFGDNYKISDINIDNTSVFAHVLENGHANWNIMKDDSETTEETSSTEDSPFNLNLKSISIKNSNIIFQNDSSKIKAVITDWNGKISGDFSASETTIKTKSTIDELTFAMSGIPYLSRVKSSLEADVNANFDNMKFTFVDSNLKLNELAASIDGFVAMVGQDYEGMDFDLKLNAPEVKFKEVLSLVPAMYTTDFKNVKADGTASLDAYIKGLMQDEIYPAFNIALNIKDAMFQYPDLPKAVNNINVNAVVSKEKQGSLDDLVADISKFTFNLGGNPFNGSLKVSNIVKDMNVVAQAKGIIDLGMVNEVYPFEDGTDLNGRIDADIAIATAMSYIEKEQFDKVSAKGHIKLSNMLYKTAGIPDVNINNASLEFTPRYVNLPAFDMKIGQNDIAASGRLENFIAYALKDQTLKGQLSIKSNYFNLNDFISDDTTEATATDTSATVTSSGDFIIPKNLNLALDANFAKVIYEKIDITNLHGAMSVTNGILKLTDISGNALGGSAKVTGSYDTSNPKDAKVNFTMNLSNVSFAETFKSVTAIQKLAPIFESMLGTYSMNLNFNTKFGSTIEETLKALTANGGLNTNNLKIENIEVLNKLASTLKDESLKSISTKDLNIPFSIENGQITTKPFTVNIGNGGAMKLEGSTGLDQSINYTGTITLPKSLNNDYLNNVPLSITGSFTNPKISLDTKSIVKDAVSNLAGKLLGGDKAADSTKVGSAISTLTDKKAQAQKIREEAQKAADKLVEAAEEQSAKLVEKAGDKTLAVMAAKAAGKKLVDEAKKQGQKLIDEAENKAKSIEAGATE